MTKPPAVRNAACPDCGTPFQLLDGGKFAVCPVALEAQRRKLLGQPGRKHSKVWIFRRVTKNS